MDLELCIDSITTIFDTIALPLQVEALACDQLASIIPCDQSVDIGGLDFALSTVCCDACKGKFANMKPVDANLQIVNHNVK